MILQTYSQAGSIKLMRVFGIIDRIDAISIEFVTCVMETLAMGR